MGSKLTKREALVDARLETLEKRMDKAERGGALEVGDFVRVDEGFGGQGGAPKCLAGQGGLLVETDEGDEVGCGVLFADGDKWYLAGKYLTKVVEE